MTNLFFSDLVDDNIWLVEMPTTAIIKISPKHYLIDSDFEHIAEKAGIQRAPWRYRLEETTVNQPTEVLQYIDFKRNELIIDVNDYGKFYIDLSDLTLNVAVNTAPSDVVLTPEPWEEYYDLAGELAKNSGIRKRIFQYGTFLIASQR